MNIFEKETDILGAASAAGELKDAYLGFLKQADDIRTKLGSRSYLLDKYLSYLFDAINETLAYNAASEGFDVCAILRGMCAGILRGESKHTDHPYFEQAKAYIDAHPLRYQEITTRVSMYQAVLIDGFYEIACKEFATEISAPRCTFDACDLNDLYGKICELLSGGEAMETLNQFFRRRFLPATAMTMFLQGAANQLIYSLEYRDRETAKQVFQLLLDEPLPLPGE